MPRKKKITDVDIEVADIAEEVVTETKVDDAVLLKVDHTHAGTMYKAGTNVNELNPSDSTLDFMKVRNII